VKLARFGPRGAEVPAVVTDGATYDLSGLTRDLDGAFFAGGGIAAARAALDRGELPELATDGLRVGSPLARPSAVICIGMNYAAHAAESGAQPPEQPVLFLKTPNTVGGPHDPVAIPRGSSRTDWEVELGVVIGTPGVYIAERDALDHVLGYCIGIDFSERDFQYNRGGQGFKGKSSDTFAPLGPFLATSDEIADPQKLSMRLSVNGELKQSGSTRDMIYSVAELVSYISRFMSLQPGDVILTGTPAGVGHGQKPPVFLQPGDVVTASIEGLGEQTHKVVAAQ
jgi:2,4-didehydro-3-deoxy-L-rhamnonate hydrolase